MTSEAIAAIRNSYGENREITEDYDKELSAKCVNGTFVGARSGNTLVFRGIPFAKPPVGKLRWKAPEPVLPDDRVFEAYYNGKSPIQTEWKTEQASYYPQGEDCLYLNIWHSTDDKTADKAVMVFFHGGSYGWGGTADPMYDGKNLVEKHPDIILVTVAYRIGLMGFTDLSYLKGGENYPDAPNLGLLDQIEALRWIQQNIAYFGGNPHNVTVFGESAGGGSVSLLPVIPKAKGLFRRIIAQSGSVALTFSKDECKEFTRRLIRASRAKTVDDLLALSESELMTLNEKLNEYNNFPQRDGRLIPFDPYLPYRNGETSDIDILIGTNSDEMNYWIGEIGGLVPFRFSIPVKFENDMKVLNKSGKMRVELFFRSMRGHSMWKMAQFYNEMMFRLPAVAQAEGHSENGGSVYMYYWTVQSALPLRKACHAVELAYVFGNTEETLYTGQPADEALSDTVMELWTSFARSGKPAAKGLDWEPYQSQSRASMVLSEQPHIEHDILSRSRKLLVPLLPYMINPSYSTLDYNVPFVRKAIVKSLAVIATVGGVTALAVTKLKNKK